MGRASMGSSGAATAEREDVGKLLALIDLSTRMIEAQDEEEVLSLVSESISPLVSCRLVAAYRVHNAELIATMARPEPWQLIEHQLKGLNGLAGAVGLGDNRWAWDYPLRRFDDTLGYFVVDSDVVPSVFQRSLLELVAHQAALALRNVARCRQSRVRAGRCRSHSAALRKANEDLSADVSDLEWKMHAHQTLTAASMAGAGEAGVARALTELTGFPVVIEDRFGNVSASYGTNSLPAPRRSSEDSRRIDLFRRIAKDGRPLRQGDRLVEVARPGNEMLGSIALVDPEGRADHRAVVALQHAAKVLALELIHQRNLAEVELRLRRDLVEDLIAGADDESAYSRAAAAGHDLRGDHCVVAIKWSAPDEVVGRAAERAAATLGLHVLLTRQAGIVILLMPSPLAEQRFYREISRSLGGSQGTIGVGVPCATPHELPRSFATSMRALDIRSQSRSPSGITSFDELGLYRVLATGEDVAEVEKFVDEWLGRLLEYDTHHHADFVATLAQYLDCGGHYDRTAEALVIHCSTLRYRLRRIREITGLDLADVNNRLNLHVATRAWKVLGPR